MTMDCTEIRERIEADPADLDAVATGHIETCSGCAAYAERLASAERLINQALRFDVGALKQQAAAPRPSGSVVIRHRRWSVAVAAAIVAGIAVWFGLNVGPGADYAELTAEVAQHWYEEPGSWVTTDVQVSSASLEQVVSGQARIDVAGLGLLSYAQSCYIRGEWVPHLVLQGQAGPVMLLLLPHESVEEPLPLELPEEGLSGVIVPHGNGSIAIMGEDAEPLQPIRDRIDDAVEWFI
jgi:hypothetical protein